MDARLVENVAALLQLLDLLVDHEVFQADAARLLVHLVVLMQFDGKHDVFRFVQAYAVALMDHLLIVHLVYAEQEVAVAGQVLLEQDPKDAQSHCFVDVVREDDSVLLILIILNTELYPAHLQVVPLVHVSEF